MNILMVLSTKKYPPDGRVEREARDLIRDGHNLYLMARRGPSQPATEVVDGVNVIRVPLPFQQKKAIADFIYFFFQRYLVFFSIIRACRRHKIDALHVHDLPYVIATVLAGKLLNVDVVFDMHEHYVVMQKTGIEAKGYRLLKPFLYVLLALLRVEERIACRWARKVIVVADEHIERINSLGTAMEDIVVVTNTEDVDYFRGLSINQSLVEKYRGDFVVTYFGGFSAHRGLDTAIKAMPAVLEKIPNAKLLLVGWGYSEKVLKKLVGDMGLTDKVIFPGFQPFELLPTYIKLSAIGLIPHISTPHIETTMPNKIFQFMMLGKPVIVSSVRPMKRVVDDARCGLVFNVGDEKSLADTIIQLENKKVRDGFGENGKKAVEDRYNWQQTVQALLELYKARIL